VKVAAGFFLFVVGVVFVIDGVLHATDARRTSIAYRRGPLWPVLVQGIFIVIVGAGLVTVGLALGGLIEPDPPGWLTP